jgi:transcription initiation factor TFIIB
MDRCLNCGAHTLIQDEDNGEIICSNCGFVASHKILDRRSECRSYSFTKNDKERVGAPLTFLIHDMGFSTTTLENSTYSDEISRILKKNIVESGDKSLIRTLSAVHALSSKIQLPESVKENAALIVRRLWRKDLKLGRNCRGIAAASLYISSKIFSIPKNMKEFINLSGISKKSFWKCYRKIIQDLKIRGDIRETSVIVSKIINQLNLRGEVEHLANKIIEVAGEAGLASGKKPDSLAAASIYLAAKMLGQKVNQRRLAKIASISITTLRSRYKELNQVVNES